MQLSGFVSVEELINSFFKGILKGYRKAIMNLERECNPVFIKYNAIESLSKTDPNVLLIYSDDDAMCTRKHFDMLKDALGNRDNIEFMLENNKGHNPNYTCEAVKYLNEFVRKRKKLKSKKNVSDEDKSKFVSSFDWAKMTEQDTNVWNRIFALLDKK